MFMSSNGLVERFSVGKSAEVEGSAPPILIEICCEVIVAEGQCQSLRSNMRNTMLTVESEWHIHPFELFESLQSQHRPSCCPNA